MKLKEIFRSIAKNPRESIESILLLLTIGILFYISMWIFY